MLYLPIPDSLKDVVDDMTEIALTDASGKVVAVVVPPGHREMLYDMVNAMFEGDPGVTLSSEEVRRAIREGRVSTTAEVLDAIKKLDAPEKQSA
jgi:hypothetical protein